MTTRDTIKRTLIGSAIATPLALAVNRFTLGNTSVKSNLIAAALGILGGGAAGYGYDVKEKMRKYREINSALKDLAENPGEYLADDKRNARVAALIKQSGNEELIKSYEHTVNKVKQLQSLAANPAKAVYSFAADRPLDNMASDKQKMLQTLSAKFVKDSKVSPGDVVPNLSRAQFLDVQQANPTTPLAQLRAQCWYHHNLNRAYSMVQSGAFGFKNMNPVDLDYIALQAMPTSLRKNLSVMHRITSIDRAVLTRGGAYELDYQWYSNPKPLVKQLNAFSNSDLLGAVAITPLAFSLNPMVRMGALVGQGLYQGFRPLEASKPKPWGSRYNPDDEIGDMPIWNTAVVKRGFDPTQTPIYRSVAQSDNGKTAASYAEMLPSAADAVRDLQRFLVKGNFKAALIDNIISRGLDWYYGTFKPYKHNKLDHNSPMSVALPVKGGSAGHVWTEDDGKTPMNIFSQILMSDLSDTNPTTGLSEYAKSVESAYSK